MQDSDKKLSAREAVLSARKCENINDPFDTYVVDYVAIVFTKLFIFLHIIPNVVTVFSMLSGVAGGILLMMNGVWLNVLGALLVFLSAVFDACDGQVARLTKHYSRMGRWLDGLSDGSVYATLFAACVVRLWNRPMFDSALAWHVVIIALGVLAFALYALQCQLPDYYKNLHMFMIDNSHGNELSRAKDLKKEHLAAKPFSFERFALFAYCLYTGAQERRAPNAQKMLDLIETEGKNDRLTDAFYAGSRRLVMTTNLMTFNLRTLVLLACVFLRVELAALLFDLIVLEPLRVIILKKYEKLCKDVIPLI